MRHTVLASAAFLFWDSGVRNSIGITFCWFALPSSKALTVQADRLHNLPVPECLTTLTVKKHFTYFWSELSMPPFASFPFHLLMCTSEESLAHWRKGWTTWHLKLPSNPNCYLILWFYEVEADLLSLFQVVNGLGPLLNFLQYIYVFPKLLGNPKLDPAIQTYLTTAEWIAGQDNFPAESAVCGLSSTAKDVTQRLWCNGVSEMICLKAVLLHRVVM